jgi:hypothetical protein
MLRKEMKTRKRLSLPKLIIGTPLDAPENDVFISTVSFLLFFIKKNKNKNKNGWCCGRGNIGNRRKHSTWALPMMTS